MENEIIEKAETPKKKRKLTKAQERHVNAYIERNYDKIAVVLPKGYKDQLKKVADESGESLSRWCVLAICKVAGITPPVKHDSRDQKKKA